MSCEVPVFKYVENIRVDFESFKYLGIFDAITSLNALPPCYICLLPASLDVVEMIMKFTGRGKAYVY